MHDDMKAFQMKESSCCQPNHSSVRFWNKRGIEREKERQSHRLHQVHCSCMLQLIDFNEMLVRPISGNSPASKCELAHYINFVFRSCWIMRRLTFKGELRVAQYYICQANTIPSFIRVNSISHLFQLNLPYRTVPER